MEVGQYLPFIIRILFAAKEEIVEEVVADGALTTLLLPDWFVLERRRILPPTPVVEGKVLAAAADFIVDGIGVVIVDVSFVDELAVDAAGVVWSLCNLKPRIPFDNSI